MAFIYRRAILRPSVNPMPRVRGGAFLLVQVSLPRPVGIALSPSNSPVFSDQAVAGAVIGTISATTSDASLFTGIFGFAAPFQSAGGLLQIAGAGATLSLTRNLTPTDIGTIGFTLSATENGSTIAVSFSLTVLGGTLQVDAAGNVQAVDPQGDVLIVQ